MNSFRFNSLVQLHENTELQSLPDDRPSLIISDFHAGDGSVKDDFRHNAQLTMAALHEYERRGYRIILNGDVEELQKFTLDRIRRQWAELYELFDLLHSQDRLIRLAGNHDLDLLYDHKKIGMPVLEALRYQWRPGDEFFIFHGHQGYRLYVKHNHYVSWLLRNVVARLPVRNLSVSHDNQKKKRLEKLVYALSSSRRIASIIGHTHRPLFESLSRVDNARFMIEWLCRRYGEEDDAGKEQISNEIRVLRAEIESAARQPQMHFGSIYHDEFVVPCVFNSGCVLGKRGITCIELDQKRISLKYWFDNTRSKRSARYEMHETTQLPGTPYYETTIKSSSLEDIFSRIHLLT
ncbi:MAG: hypothetical protein D6B26_00270 [Spirochaetaceae bacterium]|nr:MAG: hypothetical protein D6B26_00270 [Spirochaetaceae bacterium]